MAVDEAGMTRRQTERGHSRRRLTEEVDMDGGRHGQWSSGLDALLGRRAKIQPSGKIPSFKRDMGEEGGTGMGRGWGGRARRRGAGGGEGGELGRVRGGDNVWSE